MGEEQIVMVDDSESCSLELVPLEDLALQKREHLQEWVMASRDVFGEGTRIITSEFDKLQAADGNVIRNRLDFWQWIRWGDSLWRSSSGVSLPQVRTCRR